MERLINYPLPRKAAVPVHEHTHVLLAVLVLGVILFGPGLAHNHWVNGLEMTRVSDQGEVDVLPPPGGAVVGGPKMVLHVAGAGVKVLRRGR
jgi:hypothetical protein